MNIIVDLDYRIQDGTEVVFRSPVDCSQVTGLIVYYYENGVTVSKEFAFADAHGNNVGNIDHLFAENVAVKVILDVTTGMAFVQNADTNAYLEGRFDGVSVDDSAVGNRPWSSKNTVDKLCPAFAETGAAVRCEPVEGYPLNVVSHYSGNEAPEIIKLTHCGKNLYSNADYGYISGKAGGFTATKTDAGYSITGVYSNGCGIMVPIGTLADWGGNIVTLSADIAGSGNMTIVVCASDYNWQSQTNIWPSLVPGKDSVQVSIPKACDYPDGYIVTLCFRGHGSAFDPADVITYSKIQVELGNEKTAYEPYQPAEILVADLTNAPFDGGPNTYDWNTGLLFNAGEEHWYQHDLETGEFIPTEYWEWDDISQYPAKVIRNIPAISGVNTFFSDCGDTTVKGKADPVAIIERLTNAILALGGNV